MARSALQRRFKPSDNKPWLNALVLICCFVPIGAIAQPKTQPIPLQLAVSINGQPTDQIASFFQYPDSSIATKRSELVELGLSPPAGAPDDVVVLSRVPGLTYKFDFAHQAIDILASDSRRAPQVVDATANRSFRLPQRTAGAYVNYSAFLAGDFGPGHYIGQIDSGSLSLDGHLFGRFGSLSQSGIANASRYANANLLRLDTAWSYSDPGSVMSYRAGDLITGGLAWSRPIRIGGLQAQRNFGIRPDLITLPLPSISGTSAVPSTLDVYLGDVKTYSAKVPSGPYQINNIPVVSGDGLARLVLTDVTGRQIQTENSFFTDSRLLRKGLIDYSVEMGVQRLGYGLRSSIYDDHPAVIASARYGLTNQITLEGHGEFGNGLADIGAGIRLAAGRFGLLSGAASISRRNGQHGMLFYGAWDLPAGNFNLHLSTQRTLGDYQDLASITSYSASHIWANDGDFLPFTSNFPHAVDVATASYRFADSKTSVSISGVNTSDFNSRTRLLTASVNTILPNGISLYGSGYGDLENRGSYGVFAGLTLPFGESVNASLGVTSNDGSAAFTGEVNKSIGIEPGSTGGRLSFSQGGDNDYFSGYGAYRLRGAFVEASITQHGKSVDAYTALNGSFVIGDGHLFTAQRIEDSFAVVDAGAPGVRVMRENQRIGVTDSSGKFLVTGLNSYQENRLSIDAGDLPLDADIPITQMSVVPAEKAGVTAKFQVRKSVPSAQVAFKTTDGKFVAPGSSGKILETAQSFVVGYDGIAFIKDLKSQNTAIINLTGNQCRSTFSYTAGSQVIVKLGPVVCK